MGTTQEIWTPPDTGHLLTITEWEQVVQEAERITREAAQGARHLAAKLGQSAFPSVDGTIPARWGGGTQTPRYGVLHDAETPLANGYALSISQMFARTATQKSAHFMVGPDGTYQLRDTGLLAWHCGNGNRYSIGVEQTGYARFSRAEWLSGLGLAQMDNVAVLMREIQKAHGIGLYWMSDQQLLDAYNGRIVGGWATHDQCRRVLKGTTHTDPMPNYPFDELMRRANGAPAPAPAPQPTAPPRPERLRWPFPRGHYVGDINGPAESHGGGVSGERYFVKNVQEWFIYRGAVPGVWNFQQSGWDDGVFGRPHSTDAAIRWHARYYPNQPKPDQIWSDDYARLTA